MELTRILALDIGNKRTGVALSDDHRIIASPLLVLTPSGRRELVESVVKLVAEHEVGTIVVGMPYDQLGEIGQEAKKIQKDIAVLRERLSLPVIEWDERFTTVQAEQALLEANVSRAKRKDVIDKIAAAIILQNYLDHLRKAETNP